MIFFKTNATASYEKLFYDFTIKDIAGNELFLEKFKNKDSIIGKYSKLLWFYKTI